MQSKHKTSATAIHKAKIVVEAGTVKKEKTAKCKTIKITN
jgi:hypothetical protein